MTTNSPPIAPSPALPTSAAVPVPALTWTNQTRRLSELIPWPRNPRQTRSATVERLQASLAEFGQVEPICIGPQNQLYNGHQRLKSWFAKYGDIAVDVRVASRPLTEKEQEKLTIYLHAGAVGEFDWEALASWDAPDLIAWGLDNEVLHQAKQQSKGLEEMLKSEGLREVREYTRNIEAPLYTPKGELPAVSDLYNPQRAEELIREIDASQLPDELATFLRAAALRHVVFNYKRIAEYYAHAPEAVQTLMENSGLVIIDFDRAIELGYVKLAKEIAAQYTRDYDRPG